MTDIAETIARVRELDAAATKGPWHAGSKGHVYALEYTLVTLAGGPGRSLAVPPPDALLIAYYRDAAPLLAAECARLQARVAVLEEALRQCAADGECGLELGAQGSRVMCSNVAHRARAALKGSE